jgi:peptide/nickel transport system ATP-binding protein
MSVDDAVMRGNDSGLLLRVENLKTQFHSREGTLRAVDGMSFDIHRGETVGIVGESGCGKSVTAQSIMRIVPSNGSIEEGRILYCGGDGEPVDLARLDPDGDRMRDIRGKEIAMIFQEPMTSFSPVYTIGNQITEVITLHQGLSRAEARDKAIELLRQVGMPQPVQIIDEYPFNLSGGMRQRAMIAMALSCRPSLLIADEPTTAVDVTIQAQVLELIRDLQAELGMALMMITHDLAVIAELADQVFIMYLGKNVESAPVKTLFAEPKHPYTRGLLDSIPKLGKGSRAEQRIEPISGSVPSVYNLPSGCLFHPRCPRMMPGTCDVAEPGRTQVGEGHWTSCFLYGR